MNKYITRPIGEIFKYSKIKLQVVENKTCEGCYFYNKRYCNCYTGITGECLNTERDDHKDVIFKRIDK